MDLRNFNTLLKPALSSRPADRGEMLVPGLDAPLTIRRDAFAIPYIDAQTEADAWFGLGFCMAQDRAFQLELRLRTQRGTLSELIGEKTLPIDRLSRRIGFAASSRKQLDVLDADVREQIEAFVRGINAGLTAGMKRRPLEFQLTRSNPTLWRAEDAIGVGKLVSFLLIGNWDVELARLAILLEDGPEALRDIDPVFAARPSPEVDLSPELKTGLTRSVEALSEDLTRFAEFSDLSGGSNAWVLSGARTKSGRPLLANDPHLEPVLPAHWYLVNMRTPEWNVAGAALAGTPAIAVGHNGFAAWGITAGLMDTVDLFIEEVSKDGKSVRRGDGLEACTKRTEVIRVKGRPPVVEDVLETPRGPIVGPALDGVSAAISMRAVWMDGKPARGFLRSHLARSFEAFRGEFEQWPLFSQNAVYADETGRIAWQLVGEAPQRLSGSGTLPQHGANPAVGWREETVPLASMPHAVDPPTGYLVTANNHPGVVGQSTDAAAKMPFLGVDWLDEYRASRITEALAARSDWDPRDSLRLQMDVKSMAWPQIKDVLLKAEPKTDAGRYGLVLLAAWDGVVAGDSSAATVYELLCASMWRRIVRARAPRAAAYGLGRGFTPLLGLTTFTGGRFSSLVGHLRRQPAGWFERTWPAEIGAALDDLMRELKARYGVLPEAWQWGKVRQLTLSHPLSSVKALAPLMNRGPFPWSGDSTTVAQAGSPLTRPLASPGVIASMRFVVEPGDWDGARVSLPGGQSGDPFSPHYDDLIPYWLRGEGIPLHWSLEAVARATVNTLYLRPLGSMRGPANN